MKLRVLVPLLLVLFSLSGCAGLERAAGNRLSAQLSAGVLNHDDPATVVAGLPAYLLLVDGMIHGQPRDPALLCTGARLYSSYVGAFLDDAERAKRLSARAKEYGDRALCAHSPALCRALEGDYDAWVAALSALRREQLDLLACQAGAWATWLQARSDDYAAIADLPKVRHAFERIVALDPAHGRGEAQLVLGVLNTLLPAALGGQPETARAHFERALALSEGRNQMARVLYAERYARLIFDRALHDRLLGEVLAADPRAPGWTLGNVLARQRAEKLLKSAEEFF